jgi:hypothetical protein
MTRKQGAVVPQVMLAVRFPLGTRKYRGFRIRSRRTHESSIDRRQQ